MQPLKRSSTDIERTKENRDESNSNKASLCADFFPWLGRIS